MIALKLDIRRQVLILARRFKLVLLVNLNLFFMARSNMGKMHMISWKVLKSFAYKLAYVVV